jgi:hypothetical protein
MFEIGQVYQLDEHKKGVVTHVGDNLSNIALINDSGIRLYWNDGIHQYGNYKQLTQNDLIKQVDFL